MPDVMWYARSRATNIKLYDGTAAAPSIAFASEPGTGWYRSATQTMTATLLGSRLLQMDPGTLTLQASAVLGWTNSGGDPSAAVDTSLTRSGAGIVKITRTANFTGPTTTGANTGTLTNSPTTGNPSGWLIVQLEGASRYIPLWS